MAALKAVYDKQDEIPEGLADYYTEKDGKWSLEVTGLPTAENVKRLEGSLKKERDEHKAAKAKLTAWGELDPDEVHAQLERIPELETAAAGKMDEAKIEEIAAKRVQAKVAPLDRELAKIRKERDELADGVKAAEARERARTIRDKVLAAVTAEKSLRQEPGVHEDALLLAERVFEALDDGEVVTRDGVGVTPGLDPAAWLTEILPRRTHWQAESQGGGARGADGRPVIGDNPFKRETWSLQRQAELVKTRGLEAAQKMAAAAGTTLGVMPAAPPK